MRYFLIIIIMIALLFSILFLNSCKVNEFLEPQDSKDATEEVRDEIQGEEETADRDEQNVQTNPENKNPELEEPDADDDAGDQEIVQKPQNNLMLLNSEVNFAFIYPQENLMLSSYPYSSVDYGDLSLSVSISALETLKGTMKENALEERDALINGKPGPDTDFSFEPSKKIINIGDVFVKDYLVLGRYDVCDVAFDRKAVFYNNGYQVQILLSADKEKIQENMGQYFIYDELNCLEEKVWDPDKQDEFYDKLTTGQASESALEWYETFDDIMYLLQINDFKGASAGYSRLIDERYFEEDLEKNYIIDISYPQFQSVDAGGLDDSINNLIYDEVVLSILNGFKDEIISYEEEDADLEIDLNYFLAIDYSIVMFNEKGISLCLDISPYMGGAHGMLYFETINFDLEKNSIIELEDLFVPEYDYLNIISEYCREDLTKQMKQIGAQPDEEWIADGTDPAYTDTFTNFLINQSGLMIKFPAYQVGPYAIGDFSVSIPYNLFEGYINPHSIAADYINSP
jgi:hypothetical protein